MQVRKWVCSWLGSVVVAASWAGPAAAQGTPNDNCATAWPLLLGQTPGTNEGSTNSPGGVSCSVIGKDVWYSFVTPGNGLLTISTVPQGSDGADAAGAALLAAKGARSVPVKGAPRSPVGPGDSGTSPSIDSVIALYSGSCGALVPVACNDDASFFTLQSQVQLFVTAGQSFLVRVGGYHGDTGDFTLTVSLVDVTPPPNDECASALPIVEGETSGTTLGASTSLAPTDCLPPVGDIWFDYVASDTGLLSISSLATGSSGGFIAIASVYTGSCGALTEAACDLVIPDFTSLSLGVLAGQSYKIRFGGFDVTEVGDFILSLELVPGQPAANDECGGATLVTAATVSGSTELAFTGDDAGACTSAGKNVWYAWAAPANGQLTCSLLHNGGSASFDTALAVYTGPCGDLQSVACNDDFDFSGGIYESEAAFAVQAGQLYLVSVGGFLGDSGTFTLSMQFDPDAVAPYVNPGNGHTYALGPAGMTWSQARDYAQSIGGHLATFGDVLESLMVQLHFTGSTPRWIGLTDEGHEGSFTWVTGEPLAYESWQAGQPNNNCFGQPENVAALIPSSGEWIDTTETGCALGPLRGIVEFDAPTAFASSTSVGQGCAEGTPPVLLGNLPVLGEDINLTVLDPGLLSTGVIFASAIPPASTPFGDCTIQLDVHSRFAVAPVVTDTFGFSTVAVAVPSEPALVGVGFAVQAFLVRVGDGSLAITNGLHVVLGH